MHVCDTWSFSVISRVVLWRSESILALIRSSSTSTEIYQLLSCQPNIYKRRMKYRNIKKKKVGKIFQRFKTIETRVDYVVSFPGVFTRGVHFSKVSLFPWGAFHQSVTLGDNGTTIECVESVGRVDTHWKRSRTCNFLGASFWRRRKEKKKKERFQTTEEDDPLLKMFFLRWKFQRVSKTHPFCFSFSRRKGGEDIQRMYRFMNRYSQ